MSNTKPYAVAANVLINMYYISLYVAQWNETQYIIPVATQYGKLWTLSLLHDP